MPRRPRIHIDAVPLRTVQRGNIRAACIYEGQDGHAYLGWLRDSLQRERCRLLAHVLMTNHVHPVADPGAGEHGAASDHRSGPALRPVHQPHLRANRA